MRARSAVRRSALVLCLLLVAASAFAQAPPQIQPPPYKPQVGQHGKDVVWVPTPQALVEKMLDMAKVTPQDVVMDLGSGDGRTAIAAAERGARAVGVEYNPAMVELSIENAAKAGVSDRTQFVRADLFDVDLSGATVITLFLLPDLNMKLRPKLLDLRPGTRVVSNTFMMEDWTPDDTQSIGGDCVSWCVAHLWIVPAHVGGAWTWPGAELSLEQAFQALSGALKTGSDTVPIVNARLRGDRIGFTAGATTYAGTVNGSTIEGTATTGSTSARWTASRVPKSSNFAAATIVSIR
jgi:SAM-dependent methyltransferase